MMEGTKATALHFVARNEHGFLDARSLRNIGVSNKTLLTVVSEIFAKLYQEHFQGSAAWAKTLEMSEADPTVWFRHFLVLYRKHMVEHDWDGLATDDPEWGPSGNAVAPITFSPGFVMDTSMFVVKSELVVVAEVGLRQREMVRINIPNQRVVSKVQLLEDEVLLAWDAKAHVLVGRREVPKNTSQLLVTLYDATMLVKVREYVVAVTASTTPQRCRAGMDDGCVAVVLMGHERAVTVTVFERGTGKMLYRHALNPSLGKSFFAENSATEMKDVDVCVEQGAVRVLGNHTFFRVDAAGVQESAYPYGDRLKNAMFIPGRFELCSGPLKEVIWLTRSHYGEWSTEKRCLCKWNAARSEYIKILGADVEMESLGCADVWCSDGNVAPYFDLNNEPAYPQIWFNLRCIGNKFKRPYGDGNDPDAMIRAMKSSPWMLVLLTTRIFEDSDWNGNEYPDEAEIMVAPATRIVTYDFTRTVLDQLL